MVVAQRWEAILVVFRGTDTFSMEWAGAFALGAWVSVEGLLWKVQVGLVGHFRPKAKSWWYTTAFQILQLQFGGFI